MAMSGKFSPSPNPAESAKNGPYRHRNKADLYMRKKSIGKRYRLFCVRKFWDDLLGSRQYYLYQVQTMTMTMYRLRFSLEILFDFWS